MGSEDTTLLGNHVTMSQIHPRHGTSCNTAELHDALVKRRPNKERRKPRHKHVTRPP